MLVTVSYDMCLAASCPDVRGLTGALSTHQFFLSAKTPKTVIYIQSGRPQWMLGCAHTQLRARAFVGAQRRAAGCVLVGIAVTSRYGDHQTGTGET